MTVIRPRASEVLQHPLFWSSEARLSFLRDTSDRVELEDRETHSDLLEALESTAPLALGAKWDEKLDPAFITNIGQYRRYKYDSVRDLLRVMRNKLNHYRELPKEIQVSLYLHACSFPPFSFLFFGVRDWVCGAFSWLNCDYFLFKLIATLRFNFNNCIS